MPVHSTGVPSQAHWCEVERPTHEWFLVPGFGWRRRDCGGFSNWIYWGFLSSTCLFLLLGSVTIYWTSVGQAQSSWSRSTHYNVAHREVALTFSHSLLHAKPTPRADVCLWPSLKKSHLSPEALVPIQHWKCKITFISFPKPGTSVLKLEHVSKLPEELVKTEITRPLPQNSRFGVQPRNLHC